MQEAHNVGLQFEAARGEALKRFFDGGGGRLAPLEHSAPARHALEGVANRRLERPAAIEQAAAHPVFGLLAVLLAVVLRHAGQQMLDQTRVRIVTELYRWRFQEAACIGNLRAKLEVRLKATRKARDIIDDDDSAARSMLLELRQHGLHAGARGQAARDIVHENMPDLVSLAPRELAAPRLLGSETVALDRLLDARHAGIDYRMRAGAFYTGHRMPAFLLTMIDCLSLASQRRL